MPMNMLAVQNLTPRHFGAGSMVHSYIQTSWIAYLGHKVEGYKPLPLVPGVAACPALGPYP